MLTAYAQLMLTAYVCCACCLQVQLRCWHLACHVVFASRALPLCLFCGPEVVQRLLCAAAEPVVCCFGCMHEQCTSKVAQLVFSYTCMYRLHVQCNECSALQDCYCQMICICNACAQLVGYAHI